MRNEKEIKKQIDKMMEEQRRRVYAHEDATQDYESLCNLERKDMKITFGEHQADVVTKIPKGYFVWNIGEHMPDGYIILCEETNEPYHININTLKAIQLSDDEISLLKEAAGYGVTCLAKARKGIKRKKPKSFISKQVKSYSEQTLSIFERISQI